MKTIGVDVGGTKITAGLVKDGEILVSNTFPTPSFGTLEEVVQTILAAIQKVLNKEVAGIGIGVPGLIDTKKGIVHDVQNISSFKSVPLTSMVENTFGLPVFLNNDANCFALGTKNFGLGKKFNNLVGLTLGTGLGGGLVINGRLHEGVGCGAGEFGYLPYQDGILEHYCSGQFFQRQYNITGKDANDLAVKGDERALQMFHRFGYHLGEAIKIIAHVFAPEAVMLGGSVSKNFRFFEKNMWKSIRLFPYGHVVDNLKVIPALNPEIAVVGAASLVHNSRLVRTF